MVAKGPQDDYRGLALFSYGFRPFFLFGTIYAGIAIPLWLLHIHAIIELGTVFTPIDWHVHEMLYGFVPAIVTGFLLTAIPNWTRRMPIKGFPLFALFLLWILGRAAILLSGLIGWAAAAVIDVAFLVVVAAAASREIVAGRNWRNLRVVGVVSLLAAGNLTFHLEAHLSGSAEYGIRLGLSSVIFLISLVGGRIVPSFTHNWLAHQKPGRLPASFGYIDSATIAMSSCALVAWIVFPFVLATGILLVGAGLAQLLRLAQWAGERTIREPIVLVLHLAYAFIPVGFILIGWSVFGQIPKSAGIHAWTAGAVGTMILAVTTRASLGHTGRALVASKAVQAIYLVVILSAVSRIFGAFQPDWNEMSLLISVLAWSAAFLGFAAIYAPALCLPRARSL